uniref:Uncharacterized protein n=1 Tax=Tanacetum cinerariifolium TaxID=118510 RepID=A0A6L2KDK3_TANCI|nr:hypothetical protein [Tanacetum cinerariifolium]
MLRVRLNGTVQMNALADTGASVSVLPFRLYKNPRLSDHRPYHSNLSMANNTQAKSIGECQGILRKFKIDEEEDWLSCFKVGRDEDGNPKYGPMAPSFLDIKDEMEKSLAMEAYFNPFINKIVFKKLIDFLGSLSVQLKNTDLGNKGYGMYKKIKGDRVWHAKFEKATMSSHPNPLISKYIKRNNKGTINYNLQPVTNAYLKWALIHRLGSKERCQKRDMWMMNALEESHGINLAWVIVEHLCKHAPGIKENSVICGGHYVTKIAKSLGYLVNKEVEKCLESIECYEVGGSSTTMQEDNDDAAVSEQRVHTDDDMGNMEPLPPREQRHPFLRYQGLEYSDQDIADFEERLERIHNKDTYRVQVLDFKSMLEMMRDVLYARMRMKHRHGDEVVVFSSQAWSKVFETRGPLVRELILEFLSTLRFGERGISTNGDFLGPPPSYTLIRDPVLRLCQRMMAHSVAGMSQAPKKVTMTDFFYSRGLDVGSVNIPYLISKEVCCWEEEWGSYLRHLGLVPTGPARQEGDVRGVAKEALVAPGGGDEDAEIPQAVPLPPRT